MRHLILMTGLFFMGVSLIGLTPGNSPSERFTDLSMVEMDQLMGNSGECEDISYRPDCPATGDPPCCFEATECLMGNLPGWSYHTACTGNTSSWHIHPSGGDWDYAYKSCTGKFRRKVCSATNDGS